jgi:AcrR family transcriptional regulator
MHPGRGCRYHVGMHPEHSNDAGAPPIQGRRGRPRLDSLGHRRQALLACAHALFLEQGWADTALADIARSAKVALRTIYLQYGGKRGLLQAVIEAEGERHQAALADLALEGKPWLAQLEALALHLARRCNRADLLRLWDVVRASGNATLIAALDRAGPDRIKAALGAALAQALPQAVPGSVHGPDALCEHFLACVAGSRFAPADCASATERAARGLERFLLALAPAAPASQRPMVSMSG